MNFGNHALWMQCVGFPSCLLTRTCRSYCTTLCMLSIPPPPLASSESDTPPPPAAQERSLFPAQCTQLTHSFCLIFPFLLLFYSMNVHFPFVTLSFFIFHICIPVLFSFFKFFLPDEIGGNTPGAGRYFPCQGASTELYYIASFSQCRYTYQHTTRLL